jgi:hypothetical protein
MRFSELPAHFTQGFRAIKLIELPLANQSHGIQVDTPEQIAARDGNEPIRVMVGLRALTPEERGDVLSAAFARSVSKGSTGEIEQSAIYQQNLAIYTVAAAAIDPDSDRRSLRLFFGENLENAADTIRKSPLMTDDILVYLRERQESFQDEINPQALSIKDNELYDITKRAAASEDFLWCMRPGMLVKFSHSLAVLLLSSLGENSGDATISITDGENSKAKPLKKPKGK